MVTSTHDTLLDTRQAPLVTEGATEGVERTKESGAESRDAFCEQPPRRSAEEAYH